MPADERLIWNTKIYIKDKRRKLYVIRLICDVILATLIDTSGLFILQYVFTMETSKYLYYIH